MRSEPLNQDNDTSQRVLLVILTCLFALSITVPLAWRRQQRRPVRDRVTHRPASRPSLTVELARDRR